MGSKKTTKSKSTNTLPDWLKNPYMQATQSATAAAAQPAIGQNTQAVLDRVFQDSGFGSQVANQGLSTLGNMSQGNFGPYADSLVKAANGDYLTADSNPYIKGVANQGADAAQARINAQFGSAGRSNGSGLYAQLFGQGIADAANSVYFQNYENERNRQQAAAGGLLNTQLSASSQIPSLTSAMLQSNQAGLSAGNYQDNAEMERLRQYTSLLSSLSAPFGMNSSKTVEKSGGLGATLGSIAQIAGAVAAPFTGGASLGIGSALGGAMGGGSSPIMGGGFNSALSGMVTGNLPSWLG